MSIFDESNKVKTGWWIYSKLGIGAQVEGTFINKKTVPSNYGKDQTVYELLLTDGNTVLVPGKPLIDDQMKGVKLGQIVGFKYTHDKPAKSKGMNPTQFVQVFANPSIVNEDWLKSQDEIAEVSSIFNEEQKEEQTVLPKEVTETSQHPFLTDIEKIEELSIKKLGATKENFSELVMKATGIAMIAENYQEIINNLNTLPDKA